MSSILEGRSWRIIVACVAIVFLFTLGEDHRSCLRQLPVRRESATRERILRDFLITAAQARYNTALEEQKDHQPIRAEIDFQTAAHYRAEEAQIQHLPIPNCSKLFPSD